MLASASVNVDDWLSWANEQLPTLALVQPTFLLQYLCAVGRASARGRKAALEAAATDGALNAALLSVQEPLLRGSQGGVEAAGEPLLLPAAGFFPAAERAAFLPFAVLPLLPPLICMPSPFCPSIASGTATASSAAAAAAIAASSATSRCDSDRSQ